MSEANVCGSFLVGKLRHGDKEVGKGPLILLIKSH